MVSKMCVLLVTSVCMCFRCTWHAVHSSIFTMHTVVAPQWISRTVNESGLSSTTVDIVQPDLTCAIGNITKGQSLGTGGRESQLSAGHRSIRSTPGIIAHCAPDIVVADLHTSSGGSTSLKSDRSLSAHCWICIKNNIEIIKYKPCRVSCVCVWGGGGGGGLPLSFPPLQLQLHPPKICQLLLLDILPRQNPG